jgi:O-antigen ligase
MSPRAQRLLTLLVVLYITFIGGTAYAHVSEIPDTVRLVFIIGPVVVWLIRLIRARREIPRTPLDVPLALYIIWLFVSAIFALDRRISLEMIWPFLANVLLFYLLVDLMRHGWADHFRLALLAVALVIGVISVIEFTVWYVPWLKIGGLSIPPVIPPLDLALNISTIEGNYTAMLIPLVLAGAIAVNQRHARIGLIGLAGALFVIEFLTFSRGGLLGALVGVAVLVAFASQRWTWKTPLLHPRIILSAALLVIGAALLVLVWSMGQSRSDSDRGRIDIWRSGLDMTRDYPLTGVGPGLFGLALRSYRDPDLVQDKIVSAHNLFLNTLAETGIPGLLIGLWIIGALGHVWWSRWRNAALDRRPWLEGALVAFVAYGVHSLVDTFPLTSSVLPLLILAAYTAAPPETAPVQESQPQPWRYRLSWVALIGIAAFSAWIVRLDVAQFYMTLSRNEVEDGNLETALDYAERAHQWDSALSLYDLQEAYVLGLLSEEHPTGNLSRAIMIYRDALPNRLEWDLGWANLAALYAQSGETQAADWAMQHTAAIDTTNAIYWFLLGDYQHALQENPDLARAVAEANLDALQAFIENESRPADQRLYVAASAGIDVDESLLIQVKENRGWFAHLALGMAAHRLTGDTDQALHWLTLAINERPADERAYLERADVYLALGDLDKAETGARTALFIDAYGGAPGNFILAQIEALRGADGETIAELLKDSVKPRPVMQYFAGTVYARPASFDYLPQLDIPEATFLLKDMPSTELP